MAEVKVYSKSDLSALKDKDRFNGIVLIQSYTTKMTRNDKPYIEGTLQSGSTVMFKCWDNSIAYQKTLEANYIGCVSLVVGEVQEWQGIKSVVVTDITAVAGYDTSLFRTQRYNISDYSAKLDEFMLTNTSKEAVDIFIAVMTSEVRARFNEEFAAATHHDNCTGGVLAHTYKVLLFASRIVAIYPKLFSVKNESGEFERCQNKVDIYYLGVVLHDIGKIDEMNMGEYQSKSRVTHRILGLEYLAKVKDMIISYYGETAFYDLESVIVQHHDVYDEKAKTVLAFLVHQVDMIESTCMGLVQEVEERLIVSPEGSKIRYGGRYFFWE